MTTCSTTSVKKSAVSFAGNARFHLALNATNLEASIDFYTQLFGATPTKLRPGYAKWEVVEPSLNFTLNQAQRVEQNQSGLSHFGIQVKDQTQLEFHLERFRKAGLVKLEEAETSCCFAKQDKFWVQDPDGHQIEFFLVTVADVPENDPQHQACCAGSN